MAIDLEITGDVDRLPHKDLAERIIKAINEVVEAATGLKHNPGPYAQRYAVVGRPFFGDSPYETVPNEYVKVRAHWGAQLYG